MMEHYAGFVEQLTGAHLRVESRVGVEATYQKAVESLLGEDNCFKIVFVSHHDCWKTAYRYVCMYVSCALTYH